MPEDRVLRPDLLQLRALTHPVRLRILGMLRADGPATASGLAERLGLNSGATSYHLRQLAQVGLIEDDPTRGTARDRWWQAAYDRTITSTVGVDDPDQRAVMQGYHDTVVARMTEQVQESVAERPRLPREWQDEVEESDWEIALTPAQLATVRDRLHEVLSAAEDEFAQADDGSAPVIIQLHAFPRPGRVVPPAGDPS